MDSRLDGYVAALANAYGTSLALPPVPREYGPKDVREAYEVQEAVSAKCGLSPGGWKVGCTSTASQRNLGSDGPIAGRVFTERIFESGITLKHVRMDMLLVEAEFAFQVASDLPSRKKDYSTEEVVCALGPLYPAIDLIQSRFIDSKMPIVDIIGDNAYTGCLILGSPLVHWQDLDVSNQAVTLVGPTGVIAHGLGSHVLGHPVNAMVWLANFLSGRGLGLRAGEIVTTGTCFAPPLLQPDIEIAAEFGRFGNTTVRFERPTKN